MNFRTLYILAPGHSGSTLLNLVLGSHSRGCAVSELTYFPANVLQNEICTCGKSIRVCPRWRAIAARLENTLGFNVLKQPSRFDLGYMDAPCGPYRASALYRTVWKARRIAAYGSMVVGTARQGTQPSRFERGIDHRLTLYDAIREESGAAYLVDSSKEYLHGFGIYRRQPRTTRFILLTRDGRAVFHSNLKRGFGHSYSMRVWRNYYRYALPAIGSLVDSSHVLTVKYEDLATDPAGQAHRMCDFLQLEYEPGMLDIASKQHHVTSGNDMRFGSAQEIRLDTRWHTEMQAEDAAYFEMKAGALNRRLGYQ